MKNTSTNDAVNKAINNTKSTDAYDTTAPAMVRNQHDVAINIGRKFNKIRHTTVFVGNKHPIKTSMKLSKPQLEEKRMFRKSYPNSELQMIVKVSYVKGGYVHYIDEDDFDQVTLQSLIDRCQFDTSKIPIEIMIEEWDNDTSDASVAYPSASHSHVPMQSAVASLPRPLPSAPPEESDIVVEAEVVDLRIQE